MRLAHIGTAGACSLLLTLACTAGPQPPAQQRAEVPTLPGAQLALAEIVRTKPSVGEGFTYRLQATGLPQGKTYRLELRRLDGRVGRMPIGTLRIDAAGRLVTERGFRLEQHALGTWGPVLKGEPLELALVAEDGSGQVVARIIPAPIEASGAGGCRLSIELMDPRGSAFRIKGEGFEPGEEVRTPHRSEDEVLDITKRASATGGFEFIVLPAVIGKTGGSASISATGRVCSVPTLSYRWGTAMERT